MFANHNAQDKTYFDGTHRACSPEETFNRNWPLAKQLGITRVADITGLDTIGIPVCVAIRPNSRGLSTSQGKGLDLFSAKTSALMESIESWHAENIDLPLRHNSYAGLINAGEQVVDITSISTYTDSYVSSTTPIYWVQGQDLISRKPMWVPFDTVSTNFTWSGRGSTQANFVISTNGLSSGNTQQEAIAHALAEAVERDAIELARDAIRAGATSIKVKPETINDANCQKLFDALAQADILYGVYNITSDLKIPCFSCTIVDRESQGRWRTLPAFSGYGCHPSPEVAVMRAVTEAIQSRLTHISGSRDDIFWAEYSKLGNSDDLDQYRRIIEDIPASVDFTKIESISSQGFNTDIQHMLDILDNKGVSQVVVVDLSKPNINVPVVKVVVAGLMSPSEKSGTKQVRAIKREVNTARGLTA
jgi:uncharacterized domain